MLKIEKNIELILLLYTKSKFVLINRPVHVFWINNAIEEEVTVNY